MPTQADSFLYNGEELRCAIIELDSPFGGEKLLVEFPEREQGYQGHRKMAFATLIYAAAEQFAAIKERLERQELWETVRKAADFIILKDEISPEELEKQLEGLSEPSRKQFIVKMKKEAEEKEKASFLLDVSKELFTNCAAIVNQVVAKMRAEDHFSQEQPRPNLSTLRLMQSAIYHLANNKEIGFVRGNAKIKSQTYGETLFQQLDQFALDGEEKKVPVYATFGEEDVLLDMGSGLGHVVSYFAGRTKAIGIEIDKDLAGRGRVIQKWLEKTSLWFNVGHSPVELIEGNFFDFENLISQATIVYINNLVFDSLNSKIMEILARLLPAGAQIITSSSIETRRKIEKKKDGEIWSRGFASNFYRNVSWTSANVFFYLQAIYKEGCTLPAPFLRLPRTDGKKKREAAAKNMEENQEAEELEEDQDEATENEARSEEEFAENEELLKQDNGQEVYGEPELIAVEQGLGEEIEEEEGEDGNNDENEGEVDAMGEEEENLFEIEPRLAAEEVEANNEEDRLENRRRRKQADERVNVEPCRTIDLADDSSDDSDDESDDEDLLPRRNPGRGSLNNGDGLDPPTVKAKFLGEFYKVKKILGHKKADYYTWKYKVEWAHSPMMKQKSYRLDETLMRKRVIVYEDHVIIKWHPSWIKEKAFQLENGRLPKLVRDYQKKYIPKNPYMKSSKKSQRIAKRNEERG